MTVDRSKLGEAVGLITINRPDKMNSIDTCTDDALRASWEGAAAERVCAS